MSTKEAQELIVANMKKWQKIENASVSSTGRIIEKTENPIVRLVMEIIQRDSQMHYRVQELIADSLTTKAISLTPDEVGEVWDRIEKHIELEKKLSSWLNPVSKRSKETKVCWCRLISWNICFGTNKNTM